MTERSLPEGNQITAPGVIGSPTPAEPEGEPPCLDPAGSFSPPARCAAGPLTVATAHAGADRPAPAADAIFLKAPANQTVTAYGRGDRLTVPIDVRVVASGAPFELWSNRPSYDDPIRTVWRGPTVTSPAGGHDEDVREPGPLPAGHDHRCANRQRRAPWASPRAWPEQVSACGLTRRPARPTRSLLRQPLQPGRRPGHPDRLGGARAGLRAAAAARSRSLRRHGRRRAEVRTRPRSRRREPPPPTSS